MVFTNDHGTMHSFRGMRNMNAIDICPNCGCSPAIVPDAPELHYMYAKCMGCKLTGPAADTYADAITAWNRMLAEDMIRDLYIK